MNRKVVLIIDDEPDFGLLLKHFFEKNKCIVYLTDTVESGMNKLKEISPDFIFLDNNLPDGSGWSKMEYILANHPNCQLNLISGYSVPKTSALTFRILEKPISTSDLEALLKNEAQYHS